MADDLIKEFRALVEIISTLRGPEGCPWDKKQTHSSLREFLLKESYEVLEAIDEGENSKLCYELGDLLFQIVLHAQVSEEGGGFKLEDILHNINTKLKRRHPHVFGKRQLLDADEVSQNWEAIKKAERGPDSSVLEGVPGQLPALAFGHEIQRRVARMGFDWENLDGVIEKLTEEIKELKQVDGTKERNEEFGDILFTLVNIARKMDIDPEASLRQANFKFRQRFTYMEKICRDRGIDFVSLSLDGKNVLWEEAKRVMREVK